MFVICTFRAARMTNSWVPWSSLDSTITIGGRWGRQPCYRCRDVASIRSAKAIAAGGIGCWTIVGCSVGICRDSFTEDSYRYDSTSRGGHWVSPSHCCSAARFLSLILAGSAHRSLGRPTICCYMLCYRKYWRLLDCLSTLIGPISFACVDKRSRPDCCPDLRKETHKQVQTPHSPKLAARQT